MKKTRLYILFSLMVFALAGCQPESQVPDQNKIYGAYSLDYNASLNKSTATVWFYLDVPSSSNQNNLELTFPAEVSYAGEDLVFNSTERYYQKDFVGKIEDFFTYTNYNGSQYTNGITMVDSINIYVSDTTSMDSDFYFQVDGAPLDTNEVVDIYLESLSSGVAMGYSFENMSGLNIQLSVDQLNSLGVGSAIVRASRRANVTQGVQGPTVGASVDTKYSVQDTVYIY